MTQPMVYPNLEPTMVPVTLGTEEFVLVEASAGAAARYKSESTRCYRLAKNELAGMDGVGELEPLLVSLCLFRMVGGKRHSVSREFVDGLLSHIVRDLHDRIKEISPGLQEKLGAQALRDRIARDTAKLAELEEPEAKKQPSTTSNTSS